MKLKNKRNSVGKPYGYFRRHPEEELNNGLKYDWTEFCLKYKCPVIRLNPDSDEGRKIQLNPCLKDIRFFKRLDINQAFQQINQFFGTYLTRPEKEPRPISDKDKAKNHGFDKWSFRKEPENFPKKKI